MKIKQAENAISGLRIDLVLLILIAVFFTADQAALIPNYLLVEKEFGIKHAQMGAVSSIFIVIGAVSTILWGYWTDKYSRKRLLVFGTLMGEIPCFLTAFTQSYAQLFLVRALTGLGIGVILPVGYSLLGDYFPPQQRGRSIGWFMSAVGLGYLLGAVLAGIIGPRLGWRYPFILCSVPNFILIPLFYFLAKEPERGATEPEIEKSVSSGVAYLHKVKLRDFKRIITIRTNLFLNLQSIPGCIPWGVLSFWVITFIVKERGFTITAATLIGFIFGMARIVGNLYGGHMGDHFYKKSPTQQINLCIATILGAVPLIIFTIIYFPSADMGWLRIIMTVLIGFLGISLASVAGPNSRAIFLNVNVPENRGIMLSVANLTDVIGVGIGPFLGGVMADRYGLSFTLYAFALFAIPCALLWLPLIKTVPHDTHQFRKLMETRAKIER